MRILINKDGKLWFIEVNRSPDSNLEPWLENREV